jgi:hypothetical protein
VLYLIRLAAIWPFRHGISLYLLNSVLENDAKNNCSPLVGRLVAGDCSPLVGRLVLCDCSPLVGRLVAGDCSPLVGRLVVGN